MTALDFAPLLAPGLPPPAAKWNGFRQIQFRRRQQRRRAGSGRRLDQGDERRADARGQDLATYGLASGPQGYRPLREFLAQKLKRTAGITCTADEILITSGSLQALDLVNGILLARGDTIITEAETYQGSLNRWTRLGVNAVGIPLDGDGMRMDALAAALDDLKRRGVRAKYIYTVPTVQNPTGTILSEARRAEMLRARRAAWRADLRGRLLRRSDLGRHAAAGAARHEQAWRRHPYRLVFQVDRAGACASATSSPNGALLSRMLAIKTDAGSGALEQMVLGEYLPGAFRHPRAGTDARLAQKARDHDGRAQRAFRHRGRIRRTERRHLPLGQAAGSGRYDEALSGRARRRRRHQSGPGMDHRQGLRQKPHAAVLRQPVARGRSAPASPRLPKSAAASSACRTASPMWSSRRGRNLIAITAEVRAKASLEGRQSGLRILRGAAFAATAG